MEVEVFMVYAGGDKEGVSSDRGIGVKDLKKKKNTFQKQDPGCCNVLRKDTPKA